MSERKWTKGPWHWECVEMGGIYRNGEWNLVDADGAVVLKGVKGVELVKNDKYTKLVRAAPDLYEALDSAPDITSMQPEEFYLAYTEWFEKARAALQRAEGEGS